MKSDNLERECHKLGGAGRRDKHSTKLLEIALVIRRRQCLTLCHDFGCVLWFSAVKCGCKRPCLVTFRSQKCAAKAWVPRRQQTPTYQRAFLRILSERGNVKSDPRRSGGLRAAQLTFLLCEWQANWLTYCLAALLYWLASALRGRLQPPTSPTVHLCIKRPFVSEA